MRQLESERKRFDAVYTEWEAGRRASWFETDEKNKKKKLEHEFGQQLSRLLKHIPNTGSILNRENTRNCMKESGCTIMKR
jgi:hypothetical protein